MKPNLALLSLYLTLSAPAAESRVPWTGSRIQGSPEPAKPFVAEAVRPDLQFAEALELAAVPGTDRFIVVERRGRILSFSVTGTGSPDPMLELQPRHPQLENAFSVALHPKFRDNRQVFVCYALREGTPEGTRVSRFTLTSLEPLRADPASEEIVLTWRAGGHNGASLQFGPEGCLYVSAGDGGPAAPPDLYNTGQDTSDLLGAIVRIDVDRRDPGRNYSVPPDNPWANLDPARVRPELWAFGLRNPWRMSFDRATGDLWCGDVGWEMWEMIFLVRRGANYGWSAYEASQPIKPQLANPLAPISPPIVAHPHSEAASITGGFVYHGKQLPELANAYVYGDYVTGKIWALWYDGKQIVRHEEIADVPHALIAFGQGYDGEIFYLHYGTPSTLHRLARNRDAHAAGAFPRTLSETGLFTDVARQEPAPGVHPFEITGPMWEDGASATRFIGLRDTSTITTSVRTERLRNPNNVRADYSTKWPKDAVLARTIRLGELALAPAERARPIETQVLHFDGTDWQAYSFRWNDAGTDAELVAAEGAESVLRVAADPNAAGGGSREYTWRFQSRAECLRCHNSRVNGALAFTPTQLRDAGAGQVAALIDRGIVDGNFFEQSRLPALATTGEQRSARSILHVNCAHCHTPHAGGSVAVFLNQELHTHQMNMVGVAPTQGTFGLQEAKIVDPGNPWNSVLAIRMAKTGSGHMPLIGPRDVDVEALKVIEDWIARMPSDTPVAKPWSEVRWDRETIERELATVSGAMRVRRAIDDRKLSGALREQACRTAWGSTEPTIRDLFERFKPDSERERTLGARIDATALLRLSGDPERGARLVASDGKLASCQACHLIRGQGRHFGPDLSRIGAQQTPAQILDSILTPSKVIAPLYRTVVLELRDGSTQAGFVRARGVSEIVLAVPGGASARVRHTDVAAEKTLAESLMPEGQLQGLTAQEAADLVAFLASLK